jgi:hypothetical protein
MVTDSIPDWTKKPVVDGEGGGTAPVDSSRNGGY